MEKIGLIAGNNKFPLLFSQAAKRKENYLVAIAIKGETQSQINKLADKVYWLGLNEYRRIFEIFKSHGITKVVMAGQINPCHLFNGKVQEDSELKKILRQVKDKKADTIFGAIAEGLQAEGLELLNSTLFLEDYLPKKGVLTKRTPNFGEWEDIYFGLGLAKEIGRLDIGQTVAVKEKAVVAVEALEGTDNLIRRAGRIAGEAVVIVKVSKPKQDMRFDIPVVGLNTVRNLVRVKANCLAVEAGKTLFINQEASVQLSDKHGLCLVAV